MKETYIAHHFDLGDHIIMNGAVRHFVNSKPEEKFIILCKNANLHSVKFMYRDLKNLEARRVMTLDEARVIFSTLAPEQCIKTGFYPPFLKDESRIDPNISYPELSWDVDFYRHLGIPFEYRWNKFYVERDYKSEDDLYKLLNPNDEPFALIHNIGGDKKDRINYDKINKNLKRIFVEKIPNISVFSYLKLIESAKEIHCVQSSFALLVDSFIVECPLFYHNKPWRGPSPRYRLNWTITGFE